MQRTQKLFAVLFLAIGILLASALARPEVAEADAGDETRIFVDASFQGPGDGTRDRPYSNIHPALEELKQPGNIKFNVWIAGEQPGFTLGPEISGSIEQPLIFEQWPDKAQAVFDGHFNYGSVIVTGGATDVIFRGLWTQNATGNPGGLALFINGSQRIVFENGRISGGEESGACLSGSREVVLRNNVIEDNVGSGILLPNTSDITITGNTMRRNANNLTSPGMFVFASERVTIEDNTISNHPLSGLIINGSSDLTIQRNAILLNGGKGIEAEGVFNAMSILNNRILNNGDTGVSIRLYGVEEADTDVAGNVIANNENGGMDMTTSNGTGTTNLLNNTILNNGPWGLNALHTSGKFRILNNILQGHDVGATVTTLRIDQLISNHNALNNNDESILFTERMGGPWHGLDDWRARGNDRKSFFADPTFSSDLTCTEGVCLAFHLSETSPLIDAGLSVYDLDAQDIDGDARTVDRVDIGADEWMQP